MNPPLRTQEDVEAILEGIADGTIDVIATDHAPHSQDEKNVEFDLAPFGIVGLETALSLSLELVEKAYCCSFRDSGHRKRDTCSRLNCRSCSVRSRCEPHGKPWRVFLKE